MIIVIDANILFSALITPNGKLAKVISHPALDLNRISCNFLLTELDKHQTKIIRYAKRPAEEVSQNIQYLLKGITLYDEHLIQDKYWQEAEQLTTGIDEFNIAYVALTLQTGGMLWTGDKKLTNHLKSLGFDKFVNTSELLLLLKIF